MMRKKASLTLNTVPYAVISFKKRGFDIHAQSIACEITYPQPSTIKSP